MSTEKFISHGVSLRRIFKQMQCRRKYTQVKTLLFLLEIFFTWDLLNYCVFVLRNGVNIFGESYVSRWGIRRGF